MSLWDKKISPMLAFLSNPFDSKEWIFEVKFDGTRTIAYLDLEKNSFKFLNRRGIFFEKRYPEILKDIPNSINAKKVIIDGEICVFEGGKPNFYKLAEREQVGSKFRIELLSKLMPATFIVFDILHLDGEDLIDLPLMERKKILREVVKESNNILISSWVEEKGIKFFEEVKKRELEGIVAKKKDSRYEIGKRSKNWLKIKVFKSLDCIVLGYTKGKGMREEYFGALLCGIYFKNKLSYLGKVGTGFSEFDLKILKNLLKDIQVDKKYFEGGDEIEEETYFVEPKLVIEVSFMSLTPDLKFRAPIFKKIRNDKKASECVLDESDLAFLL